SYVFFFPSRSRHTSSKRDWSSDVCSSDLNSGSNDFSILDFPDNFWLCGIHSADICNDLFTAFHVFYIDGIFLVCIDPVNDCHVYVCKYYMISCIGKQASNKSTSNVSGSKLNCFFHFFAPPFTKKV